MADRILASIALLAFLIFVGFLAVYVGEIDLCIVIVIVCCMALYDFWVTLRTPNNGNSNS